MVSRILTLLQHQYFRFGNIGRQPDPPRTQEQAAALEET